MSDFLRPPGACSEKDIKARCISCGQCAQVCGFRCIEMRADYPLWGGETPRIYPQKKPCFLCMKCSAICPTDALRAVPMERAGMGTACLDVDKCMGYQEQSGIMCWTCYERCPLKGSAMELAGGYLPAVLEEGCAGCGVCAYVCPVKAITVLPARRKQGASFP